MLPSDSPASPHRRVSRGLVAAAVLGLVVLITMAAVLVSYGEPARSAPGVAGPTGPASPTSPAPSSLASTAPATTTSSTTTPPPRQTVVGIGDSVTAGTNCNCQDFVSRYAARVPAADGGPARAVNLGEPGLTSAQLLSQITQPGTLRTDVAAADVLLVTIGANDLTPLINTWAASGCPADCSADAVATVGSQVGAIVRTAKALRAGKPTTILVTDYWNVFEDGDVARSDKGAAFLPWSDALTRSLNTAICSATRSAGAICVDLYAPFKGDGGTDPTPLLASDGDHPNSAGVEVITRTLLAAARP